MRSYDELLERAKQGHLSSHEVSEVAAELAGGAPATDRYTLLHILGRSGDTAYRPLVESFLICKADPMLSRLALQILCDYWGYSELYLERVREFVNGVSWDTEEDVRQIAIAIVGEYLRAHSEPALLRELLTIFENEGESQSMREAAYFALSRATGREWTQIPPASRPLDLATGTDESVLKEVNRRLERNDE